uniref:DNA polymerase III subunit alpha n=2 Tax=Candidatus Bipolaricaulota TaxID=67810 RepID=H5SI67_9BACT|nr:DNA polymerase III subunit alpha [uncultured Acetothermia bacterium]BAL58835.1 DNA polymerase III subunit alpha [Candidatus Acetothermum autotrophicum]
MSRFVHLHVHSEYSLLDAMCRTEELVRKCVEHKMPALALTDHGNLCGAIEFYKHACEHGIKPIIGCELYVAPGSRHTKSKEDGTKYYHLTVLARNETGYRNLVKLTSLGYIEGFYYKPRVDKELLRRYSHGLIVLSGCRSSEICRLLGQNKFESALEVAQDFQAMVGPGNFYIELQNHGQPEDEARNEQLAEIARRIDAPLVATNDVHYIAREDREAHEVLLNIRGEKTLADEDRRSYEGEEYYFKSFDELAPLFERWPQALENTVRIAEQCDLKLDFSKAHLPTFALPSGYSDAHDYLRALAYEGAQARFGTLTQEITDRLEYELDVIAKMGYSGYFLIVQDFVKFAKSRNIPVGPGRGSAAGSLVCYCLGITDVDPLKYGLIFERFLNPSRVSLPDIDIDFCMRRRDEVIQYVESKYGRERVAQIATFDKMKARSVVRDVARVLGFAYPDADKIAKLIPFGATLDEALEGVSELRRRYETDPQVHKLLTIARKLEGLARNAATHAAGVVITPGDVTDFAPLLRISDGSVRTQYNMKDLETIGLLKIDFLGLRNLTAIDDTLKSIKKLTGEEILLQKIPLDDPDVYAMLQQGRTTGVFQLEGSGVTALLTRLEPTEFRDLIAILALYRPGPLESGMANDYIERKHGRQPVTYPHPDLEAVLKETYGLPIYQDQLLLMARTLAGFSLAEADILRVAVGKKKKDVMEKMRARFVEGCVQNGIARAKAEELFADIEKFARYGFVKAHSTAYALISYWTAYLKAKYPTCYLAALLTSVAGNTEKIAEYIQECRELGITVLPPDINESDADFTPFLNNHIRFGLGAIKNVGSATVQAILEARRRGGPFRSFADFCRRVSSDALNREVLESLIKCGAFDRFGTRKGLLAQVEAGLALAAQAHRERKSGQKSFFAQEEESVFSISRPTDGHEEFAKSELLRFEKELLGLYVSGHPLEHLKERLALLCTCDLQGVQGQPDGTELQLGGRIDALRVITTNSGKRMAFVRLEDLSGQAEVTVFPEPYEQAKRLLREDQIIWLRGRVEKRSERSNGTQIIAEELLSLEEAERMVQLYLHLEPEQVTESFVQKLKESLSASPGASPVYVRLVGDEPITVRLGIGVGVTKTLLQELEALVGDPGRIQTVTRKGGR